LTYKPFQRQPVAVLLSGNPRAAEWLQGDLVALLVRQGADIEVFD
jgi:hypothetical protein